MKINRIIYWAATILTTAMYAMSAVVDFLRPPQIIDSIIKNLGYPLYFLDIIGVAKIIALVVLLIPRFPRLKEWAYAGLFIHIIGAIWSHLAVGNLGLGGISMLLFLVATSYFFYRRVELAGKLHFALE